MNMIGLLSVVEEIAATSSTTEKLAILKREQYNPDMQAMLFATLDPTRRYYMQKVPDRSPEATGVCDDLALALEIMGMLAKRSITGTQANNVVREMLNAMHPKAAELAKRMILKDLRAGFGVTLTNKVWKSLIPDPPYMRCSLEKEVKLKDWPWAAGIISQEKADGMFVNVDVMNDGSVSMTTRAGTELDVGQFPLVTRVMTEQEKGHRFTGELLVRDTAGEVLDRATGNGMLNRVIKGGTLPENHVAILQVWDHLPLQYAVPGGEYGVPYAKRFSYLLSAVGSTPGAAVSVVPFRIVRSYEDALQHYTDLTSEGKEGTVIKHPTGIWFDGTSRMQVKLKMEVDVDLIIKGFTEGKGKNAKTFGAVECESACGQLKVNVSGFSDNQREEIHFNRDALLNTVMTVTANGIQKRRDSDIHSLFLPRCRELRPDKNQADDLDRIRAIFASAMKGEKEPA